MRKINNAQQTKNHREAETQQRIKRAVDQPDQELANTNWPNTTGKGYPKIVVMVARY